jgi:two-component system OmpR family sensor kinase
MSATASTATDRYAPRGDLFYAWLSIATMCSAFMWVWPGDETIPYHVAWAAFALLYGLGNWRLRRAVTGLALCAVTTGGVLVARAATGVIAWQETAEIPLMSLLMVLMVWHVRRRQIALATVTVMAERERARALDREHLTRLTSHEMRTPLTISRGYIELLLAREQEPDQRRDLVVIDDELDRLTRVTERLLRAIRLQGGAEIAPVDLDALLRQTVERWAPVAHRTWVVDARAGEYQGSAERMRASLDTLIENALRYTADGDTVRQTATRDGDQLEVSVADSGAGLSDEQVAAINQAADGIEPPRDELSQTGLGLGLVRGLVTARGGRLLAGIAPEGGALLVLQLPLVPADAGPAPAVPTVLDDLEPTGGPAMSRRPA